MTTPSELKLERVVEPSHIRRGRLATSPTWYVRNLTTGALWRFPTKRAANRFISLGGCPVSPHPRFGCRECDGSLRHPGIT